VTDRAQDLPADGIAVAIVAVVVLGLIGLAIGLALAAVAQWRGMVDPTEFASRWLIGLLVAVVLALFGWARR
jgi:uncharacterized protein YacL